MTRADTSPITVIDGGMGRQLLRMGAPFRQPEWSALALMEAPARVLEAHRDFIDAGAEVITTNSYAVVPYHIGADRFAAEGRDLVRLSAELARRAADDAERPVRVAGSLAPLFGSYEPASFDPESAPELYRPIVESLAPSVDLWLVETVSSVAEAGAALDAIRTVDGDRSRPRWLAFCLPDVAVARPVADVPALRSGEGIDELVAAVGAEVDALLINCSSPESIDAALPPLRALADERISIGAYGNTFAPEPEAMAANAVISDIRDELTPQVYADVADGWIRAGATIVGGCCGIHPEHIGELAIRHRRS